MASKAASFVDVCPVCLETRPLKIVGRCKHRFCTECISITLGSQEGNVFPCPTCKADCPRPWDGVKGMVDFTGENVDIADVKSSLEQERETGVDEPIDRVKDIHIKRAGRIRGKDMRERAEETLIDVKCKICHHRKKDVQAVNLCVKCGNLYLCQECTEVHAMSKTTQDHVLVQIRPERSEETMCELHDSLLNSYCHDCEKAGCMVCVLLDHGDHTVESLEDAVRKKTNALKVIVEENQKRVVDATSLTYKLIAVQEVASKFDRQDTLIKKIEDHAEACTNQIIKWKEDMKRKVKSYYKTKRKIPVILEKVSETVRKLQGPLDRAHALVSGNECGQEYIDRLTAQEKELESLTNERDDLERLIRPNQPHELGVYNCCFVPEKMPFSLGMMKISKVDLQGGMTLSIDNSTKIFQHIYEDSSRDKFIPCVANLGQKFAVAKPTRGEPAVAIDIFELPGTLKRTLTDHVPPLYDMSSTPDGKLAALSNGTEGTGCSVKLFDPDSGYVCSTRDIDTAKPLSLGVTLQHQYVILGRNKQGQNVITVVDKDGNLEYIYVIEEVEGPKRVTCGGSQIVVQGEENDAVFEMTGGEMRSIAYNGFPLNYMYTDISVTIWDDLFRTYIHHVNDRNELNVRKSKFYRNKMWCKLSDTLRPPNKLRLCANVTGADREARISARDGHIVVSHGQTIRVYEISYR